VYTVTVSYACPIDGAENAVTLSDTRAITGPELMEIVVCAMKALTFSNKVIIDSLQDALDGLEAE